MDDKPLITADVVDYLGKYNQGVLVLLSVTYKNTFSEGTLYYSDKLLALTVSEEIEDDLGFPIELWDGYRELIVSILKKVVPYDEIINRLDEFDASSYSSGINHDVNIVDEINPDDIQSDSK